MKKNYAVIGIGRFGFSVASELFALGNDVLAIDISPERIKEADPYVTHAMELDATDEASLIEAGIKNIDAAIVAISGDIQSSIMVTLLLKEIGVPYVAVKALNELHAKVLRKIGADRILFPEKEMGVKFARSLISSSILEHIELSPEYSLIEIYPLEEWFGKSLKDLNLRNKHGINVMSVKYSSGEITVSPTADTVIAPNSTLIVIGKNTDIQKLEKKKR